GVFPTSSFNGSNYLVDVVFTDQTGPDTTPPTVVAHTPGSTASGVATGANVTATFSEQVTGASGSTFELRDAGNALVPASVTYDSATPRAILDPSSSLDTSTTFTARVIADGAIRDGANNALANDS